MMKTAEPIPVKMAFFARAQNEWNIQTEEDDIKIIQISESRFCRRKKREWMDEQTCPKCHRIHEGKHVTMCVSTYYPFLHFGDSSIFHFQCQFSSFAIRLERTCAPRIYSSFLVRCSVWRARVLLLLLFWYDCYKQTHTQTHTSTHTVLRIFVVPFSNRKKMPLKWKYSNWLYFYWLCFPIRSAKKPWAGSQHMHTHMLTVFQWNSMGFWYGFIWWWRGENVDMHNALRKNKEKKSSSSHSLFKMLGIPIYFFFSIFFFHFFTRCLNLVTFFGHTYRFYSIFRVFSSFSILLSHAKIFLNLIYYYYFAILN